MFRCTKFGCIAIGHDIQKKDARMKLGSGCIPIMICKHCHTEMEEIRGPLEMRDWETFEPRGQHLGVVDQPLPDHFRAKGPYEAEVDDDVIEWTRVRDGIDDAVIALKGYCDELGATHMADKVQYIYRKLQDIAYTKFNMGD